MSLSFLSNRRRQLMAKAVTDIAVEIGSFGIRCHQLLETGLRNVEKMVEGATMELKFEKRSIRGVRDRNEHCGVDR